MSRAGVNEAAQPTLDWPLGVLTDVPALSWVQVRGVTSQSLNLVAVEQMAEQSIAVAEAEAEELVLVLVPLADMVGAALTVEEPVPVIAAEVPLPTMTEPTEVVAETVEEPVPVMAAEVPLPTTAEPTEVVTETAPVDEATPEAEGVTRVREPAEETHCAPLGYA